MSTATNEQKDCSQFLYFALCKLLFVHNVFYTNVKFCLQETIIQSAVISGNPFIHRLYYDFQPIDGQ